MSTDASPQHQRCPEGVDSKCFYQKALARGEQPGSHQDHPSHTALSREVAEKMLPVYRRMSDENLLQRMNHGGTQNTNECLNPTIWAHCPKTLFWRLKHIEGSVARAVCVFNEGTHELVGLMNKMYMDISFDTLRLLAEKDERRMKKGDAAAKVEAQCHHKEHTLHRQQQARAEDSMVMYMVQEPTNIVLWATAEQAFFCCAWIVICRCERVTEYLCADVCEAVCS